MTTYSGPTKQKARPRWRSIALPTEHGGWGFLLEPLLLGRLVAPSAAGLLLLVATVAAFLLRQPLKIVLVDRRRGQRTARTQMARRVSVLYALVALAAAASALALAGPRFLLALACGLPFAAVFIFYDMTRPGRTLQAELAAPLALATVAPAMALMDGWTWQAAATMWGLLAARAVPSILYVRARLRIDKEKEASVYGPLLLHILAALIVFWLVEIGLAPPLATLAFALLFVRAAIMLGPRRPRVSVKVIGFSELFIGIGFVLIVAIGYWRM